MFQLPHFNKRSKSFKRNGKKRKKKWRNGRVEISGSSPQGPLCVTSQHRRERDSPQSPVGLSPSRSRSVWPSYPRIHLASPRRPATPQPGSHSETAIKASSASSSSSAVNYQDKLMEPRATWNVFIPVTWAPQSSQCSTETSVRLRWRWNLELYTSHWDKDRETKRLQHQDSMIQTINNTHPPLHLHTEFHMCRQL